MFFTKFIEVIGNSVIKSSIKSYDFLCFLFLCIIGMFSFKSYAKISSEFFVKQIYLSGMKHLFSFMFFAVFLGSILIVFAISFAINFNLLNQIGNILVLLVFNEFSPFFTVLFFILGYSLSANEKIQNLKKAKEDVISEIYVPKLLIGLFITPLLALFFATIMILSGYGVSHFYLNIDLMTYKNLIMDSINFENILILLLKSFIFGFLSILIPIYFGHKKEKNDLNITSTIVRILILILSMLLLVQFTFMLIFY